MGHALRGRDRRRRDRGPPGDRDVGLRPRGHRPDNRRRDEVRKIVAAEFLSLDGVMESPDQWHFPYFNDEMGQAVGEGFEASDAMLMGRVLYEEWAAFWPNQDPEENPVAATMNGVTKYVVSTTLEKT